MSPEHECISGQVVTVPPGMKVTHLYTKCPRCKCDLEGFYQAEQDKRQAVVQSQFRQRIIHILYRFFEGG